MKYPDIDLCPKAYAEGRFPPGTAAKDFVKIEGCGAKDDASGWNEQETLLLLEALDMHADRCAAGTRLIC